jgi:hypothetical protein
VYQQKGRIEMLSLPKQASKATSVLLAIVGFLILASACPGQTEQTKSSPVQDATQIYVEYKPVKGHPHPDFVLPSIESGEFIQLSNYRGKKVLLLHFASW